MKFRCHFFGCPIPVSHLLSNTGVLSPEYILLRCLTSDSLTIFWLPVVLQQIVPHQADLPSVSFPSSETSFKLAHAYPGPGFLRVFFWEGGGFVWVLGFKQSMLGFLCRSYTVAYISFAWGDTLAFVVMGCFFDVSLLAHSGIIKFLLLRETPKKNCFHRYLRQV